MRAVLFINVVAIFWSQDYVKCLQIYDLRVPGHVAEGSEALLGCEFNLQGQTLYAVKWYKNDREFYRFMPGSVNVTRTFSTTGISVDVARSSMNTVTLVYMGRESGGEYRCEVTGERPDFKKVSAKSNITVDLLPKEGPQVTGLRNQYKVQDLVSLNCTSSESRPEIQLKWLINGQPAPLNYIQGPWFRRSLNRIDATDTTLKLEFTVFSAHFMQNLMTITCQATLAPLYQKEVEFQYERLTRFSAGQLVVTTTPPPLPATDRPCTSTIKIDVPENRHSEGLTVSPDGASYKAHSLWILFSCICLRGLL